ncbi:hypothetical protein DOTSEDRAFT_71577, partial [Dothistroma septosporum NZE10]
MQSLKMSLLNSGTAISNHRISILSLAHIYKMLQQQSLIAQPWRDMERLDQTQSSPGSGFVMKVATDKCFTVNIRHFTKSLRIFSLALAKSRNNDTPRYRTSSMRSGCNTYRHISIVSPFISAAIDKTQQNYAL